jgi:hypothetical protein
MNDEDARLTPEEEEELLGAVIRRTSGGACRRAEELLAERLDGKAPSRSLAPTPDSAAPESGVAANLLVGGNAADAALLESHLEHCAACAAIARSLAVAAETLPSLAAFDPGPSFTAAVLAATSRAEAEELRHVRIKPHATYVGASAAHVAERIATLWNSWLARPRFAFEVAYVATILILVIVGNPASRLQAASERTVVAAAAGFERAREAWPAAVARVTPSIEVPVSVRALRSTAGSLIAQRAASMGGLGGAWSRALAQWSVTWEWIRGTASGVAARAWEALKGIRDGVWQSFNGPATEPGRPVAR